jgi:hypothetical protein
MNSNGGADTLSDEASVFGSRSSEDHDKPVVRTADVIVGSQCMTENFRHGAEARFGSRASGRCVGGRVNLSDEHSNGPFCGGAGDCGCCGGDKLVSRAVEMGHEPNRRSAPKSAQG